MDRNQRDLRSAAEQEFLDSLHQLQETLKTEEAKSQKAATPSPHAPNSRSVQRSSPKAAPGFSLDELEQAVADIEAFMNSH
ncbi:hypothetical protein H6G20_00360 [Desertifilum sp. FACHB-1129]|uniref:Uncharacterized protein n=2 Tax=Desertifilum tharense IPPAS B-1220 TaxID=1781255 RepID=A0A1E5QF41_9CYAN|nr:MULTISPECIES: hypothetical protein [Desertifilum]MDA0211610.1 hypothetical protein [Cyanobacteria bacterium FC1]MBD2310134.1 hypothetical protein [Desertifilum sp. FACHB-1129]MBD2322062.1 hypothetical protein [Desertifilum sp. FACHB-866]MBD2333859.1 hypothetical protein [Desertifilum sp. FACHB-868]OEJ73306.1 hypothetical protein BH720_20415 [Desertifilum tharense IPPAS B-1220]